MDRTQLRSANRMGTPRRCAEGAMPAAGEILANSIADRLISMQVVDRAWPVAGIKIIGVY